MGWFYNAERIECEHYSNALQQGTYAAWNMLGRQIPYDMVPIFWTKVSGVNLYYTGSCAKWDKIVIDGDVNEKKFLAYYIKDERVDSVAGMGRTGDVLMINQAMRLNIVPNLGDFKNGVLDLESLRARVE